MGRIQPANYALWLWKSKETDHDRIIEGLDLFFKEHKYLDMGRKRPYPHEQNKEPNTGSFLHWSRRGRN